MKIQHEEMGMERGSLNICRNRNDTGKPTGRVFITQDSLQHQTLEKIIFATPITKLLCICKRGKEPAHRSLIPRQRRKPCANSIHGKKK